MKRTRNSDGESKSRDEDISKGKEKKEAARGQVNKLVTVRKMEDEVSLSHSLYFFFRLFVVGIWSKVRLLAGSGVREPMTRLLFILLCVL